MRFKAKSEEKASLKKSNDNSWSCREWKSIKKSKLRAMTIRGEKHK